jgi:hypothetical protein
VAIAMRGRSPSAWLRGKRVSVASTGFVWHAVTDGSVTCRRTWAPQGVSFMVKVPSAAVMAQTTGVPETWPSQRSQVTPSVKAATGVVGT